MKRMLHSARMSVLLLLAALMTSSCFFGSTIEPFIGFNEGDTLLVSISSIGNLSSCQPLGETTTFICTYVYFDEERPSTFTLSGLEVAFLLLFADPIVLQLPQEATDFKGSFSQGSTSGNLVIKSGLASLRADATQTFQAEPGMQLVVLDLPEDAPESGEVSFNFNFTIPDDLPSPLEIKALYTGRITDPDSGETYYPPLLPCTTEMAAVPIISIPLPQGGNVPLPTNVQGCDNVTYSFQQVGFSDKMFLPLVDQ